MMTAGRRHWFLALCVAGSAAALPQAGLSGPAKVALTPCSVGRSLIAECGTIRVFENRGTRVGRTIEIHFTVVRADAPGAHDAVVVFAGGPGEGSTSLAGGANGWLRPLRATLDFLFVDQRGTGQSNPLSCASGAATDPAVAFGHVFDPQIMARCRATLEGRADLTQYTTDLAVADVDDVRAALGYERISLYGGSYGTRMAQAYMRRYPDRVRSVVIDGTAPFDVNLPLTYAASAQQSIGRVFEACAASAPCRGAHPTVAADFDALLHRLDAGPARATIQAPGGPTTVTMSRGDFVYAVRGILYGANAVTRLPDLIGRTLASGSFDEFAQAYYSREVGMESAIAFGQHLSVLCAEDVPFATDVEVDRATSSTFIGRYLFDEYRGACRAWPRGRLAPDARTPATTRVPVLLVSGFFDPVTPPQFADRIARSLPLARTVIAPASAHGSASGCPRAAALYVLERATLEGVPDVCRQ
jgi:pimeloyl-ACP methyl ester carboxylesterase